MMSLHGRQTFTVSNKPLVPWNVFWILFGLDYWWLPWQHTSRPPLQSRQNRVALFCPYPPSRRLVCDKAG
jgi:hypothetical protein